MRQLDVSGGDPGLVFTLCGCQGIGPTLALPFVLAAVERALSVAVPEIWNSDQGSQFTSSQYLERLLAAGVRISMDGRGRAMDNIFTERLWRTVKYEEVYLNEYRSPREARNGLSRYFDFYNHVRPHQALDYLTPGQIYHGSGAARLYSNLRKETTLASPVLLSK